MGGPDVRDLALMLADDIEAVVAALDIDVKRREGRKLVCFSPWNSHPKPKLEIELTPIPGRWNDWIEGRWGDALGLVACAISLTCEPKDKKALSEAIKWAKKHFGLEGEEFDREAWARRKAEAEARRQRAEAQARRELAEQRRTAHGLWLQAVPLTADDHGWKYLLARGVDLALLPRQPRAIRYAAAAPWYDGESREPAHIGPALMSIMTLSDGKPGSLHRTWLNPYRPGQKADLDPPRKMWPASEGAAIRLWRGATNLSEKEAQARGVIEDIVLCEGVEDGLSIALMTPELRISAVGSLPGLLAYSPPKFVRRIIVAADNDWGKPQAQALLDRACRRLVEECGKLVSVARSPEGKDFNDLLQGKE